MTDLLSRLSSAEEGSRELDAEVAYAVGWRSRIENPIYPAWWCSPGGNEYLAFEQPHYTTSIDVALTLVPERIKDWNFRHRNGSVYTMQLCIPSTEYEGRAWTAPLAICLAALRAREEGGRDV